MATTTPTTYYYGKDKAGNPVYESSAPKSAATSSVPKGTNVVNDSPLNTPGTTGTATIPTDKNGVAPSTPVTPPTTPPPAPPPNLAPSAAPTTALTTAKANVQGVAATSPAAAPIAPTAITASSPYTAAHQALTSSGVATPSNAADARAMTSKVMPPAPPDTSVTDSFLAASPGVSSLMDGITKLLNPQAQTTSLLQDYKSLYKESGLDQINKEIIDADTIINGTEQDIRNEIQGAGGFGTESQVQAMALSRNKSLLKRYNQLVQMKTDATNQLNTLSQLNYQDKQMAQTKLNTQIDSMFKLADFQEKAANNIREGFSAIVSKVGYAGAFQAYANDPRQLGFIEQTMGLQKGGLAALAAYKVPLTEEEKLRNETLRLQAQKLRQEINTGPAISTQVVDLGGKKLLINSKTGETIKELSAGEGNNVVSLAQSKGNIDLMTGLTSASGLASATGPNVFARGSGGFWDTTKKFLGGATAGGVVGAAAGAPFAGIGAIPGAIGGAIIGGTAAALGGEASSFTGDKQNFIAGVQQVTGQLTLDKLAQAKQNGTTFGALSDSEREAVGSAATKIGTWTIKDDKGNVIGYNTTEKALKQELDKIGNFAKLDYILKGGTPEEVGVVLHPDGTFWTQNSDGSFTQLN